MRFCLGQPDMGNKKQTFKQSHLVSSRASRGNLIYTMILVFFSSIKTILQVTRILDPYQNCGSEVTHGSLNKDIYTRKLTSRVTSYRCSLGPVVTHFHLQVHVDSRFICGRKKPHLPNFQAESRRCHRPMIPSLKPENKPIPEACCQIWQWFLVGVIKLSSA